MLLSNKRTKRYLATGILLFMVSTSLIPLYAFCNDEKNVQEVEAATYVAPKTSTSALVLSYSVDIEQPLLLSMKELQSSDTNQQESVASEDVSKQDNVQPKVQSTPEPTATPEPTPKPTVKPTPTPKPKKLASNGEEYVYYKVYDNFYGSNEWHSLSKDLQEYTYELCIEYGIEKYYSLILCQLYYESQYNPNAVSKTSDYGLAQINKCNHASLKKKLGITDFLDPYQSILCNIYMMSDYLKNVSAGKALIWYNAGNPDSKNSHSRHYSENIISLWNNYVRVKE